MNRRKPKLNFIVNWAFWFMTAICCWNLNGITYALSGRGQLFSIILLLCCAILLVGSNQRISTVLSRTGVAYAILMVVLIGVGFILSQDLVVARAYFCAAIIVVASGMGAREIIQKRGYPSFIRMLAIVACLGSFSVFLSPIVRPYYTRNFLMMDTFEFGRWNGFFINPNNAGYAGVHGLLGAIGFLLTARTKQTALFCYALAIGCGISMFLTFSRGAMITAFAFIVSVAFFLVTTNKQVSRKFRRLARIAILACIALVVVSIWFIMIGADSFNLKGEPKKRVMSMRRILSGQSTTAQDRGGRLQFAKYGLSYWSESPVIGHGIGKLQQMPPKYGGIGCHNMHITVLGEVGIVGFLPYLIFLGVFATQIRRSKFGPAIKVFLYGTLGVYMIRAMASHNVLDDRITNVFWGIAFAVLSLSASSLRDDSIQPQHRMLPVKQLRRQPWF